MAPRTKKDAIALLKEDHKKVKGLLSKLEKSTERASETREELLAKIGAEIRVHTTIEEEIFYPAYKEAVSRRDDKKLYDEAVEEHHVADFVLGELASSGPQTEQFSAKAKVLKDLIEHHIEEEEGQMFVRARREMEASELNELGARMAERKRELEDAEGSWLPAPAKKLLSAVTERVERAAKPVARTMRSAAATGGRKRTSSRSSGKGSARGRKSASTSARGKKSASGGGRSKKR